MHRGRSRLVRVAVLTLAVGAVVSLGSSVHASASASPRGVWLPPAYLAWRTGGLPAGGLQGGLEGLQGVERAIVVAGDTLWMVRSTRAHGTVVDDPPRPFDIPIETFAVDPRRYGAFVPGSSRDTVVDALAHGRGVLGETSAGLRRLDVGDRMVFPGGKRVTVGAIMPDEVASWSELLVSRTVGERLRVTHNRFALLDTGRKVDTAVLARRIHRIVGPGYPIRVRAPGKARFRRVADSVWPQVLMKVGFGEFAARPDPGRPGYLDMSGKFVRRYLVSRHVPLLGRFTCHRAVFPPLIDAMRELKRSGLAGVIHNFAGCYNARTVLRSRTGPISHHSWGAAVDINSIRNPYGQPPRQHPRLVAIMGAHGFTWGGRWTVPDGMHFEYEVPSVTDR
ncbi:MAG: M15 family metallopeptidase [Actinomycetota bacterium]